MCLFLRGEFYWPSWRTLFNAASDVSTVEPAYYYRISGDLHLARTVPAPLVLRVDLDLSNKDRSAAVSNMNILVAALSSKAVVASPRVVLDIRDSKLGHSYSGGPKHLLHWAHSSVSDWKASAVEETIESEEKEYVVPKHLYLPLPMLPLDASISPSLRSDVDFRLCSRFLNYVVGNRSCFSKCK